MNLDDKKTRTTIFNFAKEYYSFAIKMNKEINKIDNEPYLYSVGKIQIYIFNDFEINNFLEWYIFQEEFLLDFNGIGETKICNYFSNKIQNYKTLYPDYNQLFFNNGILHNIINEIGINNFINELIIPNRKTVLIYNRKNIIFKYKTIDGKQQISN